jgi:hypothetical protein
MLMNPQIAKITAAKKRMASHHGIWITTIPIWTSITLLPGGTR